ncbi:pilus assembly protein [Aureimonas sp. AU12]|uniref:TadE family protein n=1 Tax=Aureimonas sp. AU12 TaxID=1638161 RepID=UPI00244EE71D|nr:pilus assembly protein [Aureimonas sp. AU12]
MSRDKRGSSAVEFALVAPVFLLMLAFMANGGLHLYVHSTLVSLTRETARGLSLGYMTEDEAKTFVRDSSSRDLGVDVALSIVLPDKPHSSDVRVTLLVTKEQMARFAPFTSLLPFALSYAVTMRSLQ